MPVENLVLTHGDLDGMVSGILLLQSLPADGAEVRITNGYHLARELAQVAGRERLPSQVLISDIPLLATMGDKVTGALADLHARGVGLLIYDHHFGWDKSPELPGLCAVYCVETSKTTAAALIWRERLRGDRASQQWLRLLSEKAGSDDPVIRVRFGLLAALMQPQHYPHTLGALRALAAGGDLPDECRGLSAWYYSVHVPAECQLARDALVLETASGRRLGWVDLRGVDGYYLLAPLIIAEHDVDAAVTVTDRGIVVGGPAVDQGTDLSPLHGEHEVDGVAIHVGGHKSPISLTPVGTRKVTDTFVAAATQLLLERL